MEQAEEDDGFNTSIMLAGLKPMKDTLKAKKDKAVKARDEDEAKVEQLLKDDTELNPVH